MQKKWFCFLSNYSDNAHGVFICGVCVDVMHRQIFNQTPLGVMWCIQDFFKEHPAAAAARTVQQCIENIRLNAEQLKRDGDLMHQFLASYQ